MNWWYYSYKNKEKPITYIGSFDLSSENKVIIQDDADFEYRGVYRVNSTLNTRCSFLADKKKVSSSLIQKRLNKIVNNNFTQLARDFLDNKKDIETIL